MKKVLDFMDRPWQEDAEIELVGLMEELRAEIEADTSGGATIHYLKDLIKFNNVFGDQRFSEVFLDALSELTGIIH